MGKRTGEQTDMQADRYPDRQAAGNTYMTSTKFSPRLTITEMFAKYKLSSLGISIRAMMAELLRRQTWNPE